VFSQRLQDRKREQSISDCTWPDNKNMQLHLL
jgi:hypothetical protein